MKLIFVLLIFGFTQTFGADYMFVVPKKAFIGQSLTISVAIYANVTEEITIQVELYQKGVSKSSPSLLPCPSKKCLNEKLTMNILEDVSPGEVTLHLSGSGGITFKEKRSITIEREKNSVFVMTDKAVYKPGDTVQFRVVVTDKDLKAVNDEFDIIIKDPSSNHIQQHLKQTFPNGVFSNSLQLSDVGSVGIWHITIKNEKALSFQRQFKVEEYVLSKFEVIVKSPSHIVYSERENDITITVHAKYTYSKNVAGFVTLYNQCRDKKCLHEQEKLIDGVATFSLKPDDIFSYNGATLIANVTEEATGIVLSADTQLQYYIMADVAITYPTSFPKNFKPGLSLDTYVMVTKYDGSPLDESSRKIKLDLFAECSMKCKDLNYAATLVPSDGKVQVSVMTRTDINEISLQITGNDHYGNFFSENKRISAYRSELDVAIRLYSAQSSIQPGSLLEFNLTSTVDVSEFHFQGYSKNHLVISKHFKEISASEHTFSVEISSEEAKQLAPTARFIVWIVTGEKKGEIIADSFLIAVDTSAIFSSQVDVSFDKKEVAPGASLNVVGNCDKDSFVAILAVDKSVLLMGSDNQIDRTKVLNELSAYDPIDDGSDGWPCYYERDIMIGFRRKRSKMPCFLSLNRINSAFAVFDKNNLMVITDATVHQYEFREYDEENVRMESMADGPTNTKEKGTSVNAVDTSEKSEIVVRENFVETWIFKDRICISDSERFEMPVIAPDTITSWIISAFSMHPEHGLGIASPSSLKVFQPFFLSLTLPYSMKRKEFCQIKISIFNYLHSDSKVKLTIEDSPSFKIYDSESIETTTNSKQLEVASNTAETWIVWIEPSKLGDVDITVIATPDDTTLDGDAVTRSILVEAEGISQEFSKTEIFSNEDGQPIIEKWDIRFPTNLVEGSQKVIFTVTGDFMGASMSNMGSLIRMPFGCGEQNMINFAPNIFILKYMNALDIATSAQEQKAIKYMKMGYQREMQYKRDDFSFSAFGKSDKEGSTWLTAFVVKSFNQASSIISIVDMNVVESSMTWLLKQQNSDGSFRKTGFVHHSGLMGGSGSSYGLTAYVLIALVESSETRYDSEVAKARNYLKRQVLDDAYGLAIVSYALSLSDTDKDTSGYKVYQKLLEKSVQEGVYLYWTTSDIKPTDEKVGYYSTKNSYDIEMTAYGLLSAILNKDEANAVKIMKWLTSQQNSLGGYGSTQDTVVALQALSEYATDLYKGIDEQDVSVSLDLHTFEAVVNENKLIVQQYQIDPRIPDVVLITIKGKGICVVQMTVMYNIKKFAKESPIVVQLSSAVKGNLNELKLKACVSNTGSSPTGMVVVELDSITGYSYASSGPSSVSSGNVNLLKRNDVSSNKMVSIMYISDLGVNEEICIVTSQFLETVAKNRLAAKASAYPYYNQGVEAQAMYIPKALDDIGVCGSCPECCQDLDDSGASLYRCSTLLLFLMSAFSIYRMF